MFFCPKCNFSLDLSKVIPQEISGNLQIKNPKSFIDMFNDNDLEGDIKIVFTKKDLIASKDYKKLSDEDKDKIIDKFNNISNVDYNVAYFVCNNCQFVTKLNQGTNIYKVSFKTNYMSDDNSNLKIHDYTLPRTKDYICPNNSCLSHKDHQKKEAVFYRPNKNTYNLQYSCTLCNLSWDIKGK
jgi:hypothetical protein